MWERIVGIVKHSFKACINNRTLDTDSFDALCSGIAGVVNRRPLTRATDSLEDMMVLSPAHFLYPYNYITASTSFLPPIPDLGDHLRSSWKILRETLDTFWEIFAKSYLVMLTERTKRKKTLPPLKIGDVVLISEVITPRERWKIAVIIEILSEDVNVPRTFKLRDSWGNEFVRHRTTLIKLELESHISENSNS